MANLRTTYSNAAKILDCIQTITTYQKYLTKVEYDINDPASVARLIMRRILKENFNGFNIRKNLNDYALKCEDENIYSTLYAAKYIFSNTALLGRFSPSIRQKLEQLRPVQQTINALHTNFGIRYSFRTDKKFFVHIDFNPLMNQVFYDKATFDQYSMNHRIEQIILAGKGLAGIKLDPIYEVITKMVEENNIYHIYENNLVPQIDEDFLNFYMAQSVTERSHNIREIYKKYHKIQQAKIREALAAENKEEPLLVVDLEDPTLKPIELREVDAPVAEEIHNVPGLRAVQRELIPEEAAPVEEVAELPTQDLTFIEALQHPAGLRLRRTQTEARPLTGIRIVPRGEFELATMTVAEDPQAADQQALFVSEEAFMLYMQQLEDIDTGLTFTSVDLYDDDDEDKDGLYFTTIDGQTVYIVFNTSEEVYRGTVYEEAKAKFIEVFGQAPTMVKYCNLPESAEIVANYEPEEEVEEITEGFDDELGF